MTLGLTTQLVQNSIPSPQDDKETSLPLVTLMLLLIPHRGQTVTEKGPKKVKNKSESPEMESSKIQQQK